MKIDTRGNRKKHIRHLASVDGPTARTNCKRTIRDFWTADNVSYFYTDKSRYSYPCRICLPEDYKQMIEAERKSI
jgi:hypothetical protein